MFSKHNIKAMIAILMSFSFFLTGCVAASKSTGIVSDVHTFFNGTYKIDPYMKKHMPRTIAVLPFVNESSSQKGTKIVRAGFYNHFSSLPFLDMELVQTDHLLQKAGYTDPKIINNLPPQKFKELLNVDAVVYGTISNFDKLFLAIYSQVSVGAQIKMYDTNGHFLWEGAHISRIHEGGISTSPIGIIAVIAAAAMNMRDIQLLRACDDLFRDMVKTIPVIKPEKAIELPTIKLVAFDAKGVFKKVGDKITVVMKGDPGKVAWFDIGGFKKGISMKEVEPGGYVGEYRVVYGDNVKDAVITGYLSNGIGTGAISSWVDPFGTLNIDTTPPAAPKFLHTKNSDKLIKLLWEKNKEEDLAKYNIYKSKTPLSGFIKIGSTEFTNFSDSDVTNLTPYFYQISAVDKATNESKKSIVAKGIAMPPGPTHVSGLINKNTTWYAASSPYIIDDTVIVDHDTILTIEPGTHIISNGPGLIVKGSLKAKARLSELISFSAENNNMWKGIVFQNSKKNEMKFCQISKADIAIFCKSSFLEINNCEFTKNKIGVKISGSFSNANVKNNNISHNSDFGILEVDGAKASIINNIINKNKTGIKLIDNKKLSIKENTIINNQDYGIWANNGQVSITKNNIFDNQIYNIFYTKKGNSLQANTNWWGSDNWEKIIKYINGKIVINPILNDAYPQGEKLRLPVLESDLNQDIVNDSILVLANSPYKVLQNIIIDNKAKLYIQPGVTLLYDKKTSIIVKNGGIVAVGLKKSPIIFTSASSKPYPGNYTNAVSFIEKTSVNSFFKHCIFKYAKVALNIDYGMPSISHCKISDNFQTGIYCKNDSSPRISHSTITKNYGTAGIVCVGSSNPKINFNNIFDNKIDIQAFSSIYIDARNNYWGKTGPIEKNIMAYDFEKNINFKPWLKEKIEN